MPTILITGAARGLGLAFAHAYAQDGWRVHACARGGARQELADVAGDVVPHALDVRDRRAIDELVHDLAGEPIDVLMNNAGILVPEDKPIAAVGDREWLDSFHVNAIAPLRIADALTPNVAASRRKLMVFLTSRMGSVSRMAPGGHPYRMSKAALNSGVRCLALDPERRGITLLLIHPGWVRTDMGTQHADIDIATSVAGVRQLIAEATPEDNGRFLSYDGSELPW
jgi:NAD(P)-dependent dehydrogenase (short-subunit alcohol dehydrogenase family)